jgi:peptide/nickel transport system substrate-binding protein
MTIRRSLLAVLVFVLASACVALEVPTPIAFEPAMNELVVGLAHPPVSLDPADHRSRNSETVIRNMFDSLTTRDNHSGVHLELAQEITRQDERTLLIRLREGVLFHDGVEMTAEDVVFSFNRIIQENAIEYPEPHSSPRQGLIAPLETIEQIDDYTVLMHFSGPWPVAYQMLVHQQIVPKHYVEQVGTKGFQEAPIGTGPFKFVSADFDLSEVVLERFDDYYGGSPDLEPVGSACIDQAVFRYIPDARTRAAALTVGEVDIIQSVPLELLDYLADNASVQVKDAPGTQPLYLELNVRALPFNSRNVRLALNYAVDRVAILKEVYGGRGKLLAGPLSPYNSFVNIELTPYPYDQSIAVDLLAQAGWWDLLGEGLRRAEGDEFRFTIDTVAEYAPVAEMLSEQYAEIGIEADVRIWEREVIRPLFEEGQRVAYLDSWEDSAFDPVGHLEAKWHGRVADQPYGRGNFSGYNNGRVNFLIREGELTANPLERQIIYSEAQEIIYSQAPAVFLILPEAVEAASTKVVNWEPAADGRINLHDVCLDE